MIIDYEVLLDLVIPNDAKVIETKQYDDGGRRVIVHLSERGQEIEIPSGATFTYSVSKPDKTFVKGDCDDADGYPAITLTQNMLACAGIGYIDITMTEDGEVVSTMRLKNIVRPAAVQDTDVESTTEYQALEAALEAASDVEEAAEAARGYAEAAEEAAQTLTIDPTLTQSGQAADAEAAGHAVGELKSTLPNIFGINVIDYINGYYIDTGASTIDETPVASASWSYAKFNCEPNTRVSIIGYGSSGGRLYCFFDANGNVLEKASGTENSGGDGVIKTYVAPANTSYCIVNSSNRYKTKYIITSPLMQTDKMMHLLPSTLLTDTSATLESIPEGYYRVYSAVSAQLPWSPSGVGFNMIVFSRSIYPNTTTERIALAIDTSTRLFINVSGSSGYTGWRELMYTDDYQVDGTLSEYVDCIINPSGFLVPSAISVASDDFIKDTVVGFRVIDSTIKVAVNRYTLAGAHANKQYWYISTNTLQDGKYHYKFDHSSYKYRIYILNSDESAISNKPKLVNGVRFYEDTDLVAEYSYHDADYDTFKKHYNLDNLSTRLRQIQEENYNISYANANDWIKLYEYSGDMQVAHPKVLYFPNRLFGHKYWMAYTPYPNANAYYENPCIAYSDDGYRFMNIDGNPIDEPTTDRTKTYYSDTHLVYRSDTGVLECWYRLANENDMTETFYRMTTTDGFNWGDKRLLKTINSGNSISKFLSPAVIWEDGIYKIWTVNYSDNHIEYWEANADVSTFKWKKNITMTFSSDGETHRIWHIDVEKIDGVYVLVAMTRQSGTRHWPLYISTSADNETWETPWLAIKYGDTDKWDSRIYRSCIVEVDGVYRIYYSAYDTSNKYHTAISESSDLHHFVGRDVVY